MLLDHFMGEAAIALNKKKPTPPKELAQLLATYSFPGNIREIMAMVYDAVSVHRDRILSMESFRKAISSELLDRFESSTEKNPFSDLERLPTFGEAAELLVSEAMVRAGGNQTIAARLLGITQSALSKRLKLSR
jgi:transcriptional regulator with AAA-type ATPase domain